MRFFVKVLEPLLRRWSKQGIDVGPSEDNIDEIAIYRDLFRNLSQVIWVDNLDKSKSILNVGSYERFFDRPVDALKTNPRDWLNAIHEDDRHSVEAKLGDQLKGVFNERYRVVHQDGSIKWLRDRSFILRDQNSQPQYLAGVVEDITAEILVEDRLRQKNKMAAVGEISGGVAHDFNNILAIIQGNVELAMLDDIPLETREFLRRAFDASQKGATLTHRLLAYSRLQPLSPEVLDPSEVIKGLQEMLSRTMPSSVALETISGAGLWKCEADKNELETALLNLAINADHAMNSKGKMTVEAFNARLDMDYARQHEEVNAGQYVCFAVTDTGCGMSEVDIEKAIEPFYTTKAVGEGSGLGLSMAFGFAKQSGGHLKLYSEVGRGTTVKLYLPRSKGRAAAPDKAIIKPTAEQLRGMPCLIIEDDENVLAAVVDQARSLGLVPHQARGTDAALAVMSEHPEIDLVLCDVVLAGEKSGPEVVNILLAENPNLRAAFMSGYTENSIIHDGKLDDGIILLQKPFTIEQLLTVFLELMT